VTCSRITARTRTRSRRDWSPAVRGGDSDSSQTHPASPACLEAAGNWHPAPAPAPGAPYRRTVLNATTRAVPASDELLGGRAASMALVNSHRMHFHLLRISIHSDRSHRGDPSPARAADSKLTPSLLRPLPPSVPAQVRHRAHACRRCRAERHVHGERSRYLRSSTSPSPRKRCGYGRRSSRGKYRYATLAERDGPA